jgi:hypothetical protein
MSIAAPPEEETSSGRHPGGDDLREADRHRRRGQEVGDERLEDVVQRGDVGVEEHEQITARSLGAEHAALTESEVVLGRDEHDVLPPAQALDTAVGGGVVDDDELEWWRAAGPHRVREPLDQRSAPVADGDQREPGRHRAGDIAAVIAGDDLRGRHGGCHREHPTSEEKDFIDRRPRVIVADRPGDDAAAHATRAHGRYSTGEPLSCPDDPSG